jgi:hypothetical protein
VDIGTRHWVDFPPSREVRKNDPSGEYSVVNGGFNNKATGDYSIAMGTNALAEHDNSFVMNLATGEDTIVKSQSNGRFLLNGDAFTISIGTEEVTINSSNIGRFKNLLLMCTYVREIRQYDFCRNGTSRRKLGTTRTN